MPADDTTLWQSADGAALDKGDPDVLVRVHTAVHMRDHHCRRLSPEPDRANRKRPRSALTFWTVSHRSMQAFTGIHLGLIVATTWILLMNAVIGFQLMDDGTALSIGLILLSATALFIGTGYIALDTGFSWTSQFEPSLTDPNRNIGLYVLYQLVPLVFLALFFLLETFLVLRVLGEVKPLRKSGSLCSGHRACVDVPFSLPHRSGSAVRHWPDLSVRHQHTSVQRNGWQDRRCHVRDVVHPAGRRHALVVLVQHHGGRLADAHDGSRKHGSHKPGHCKFWASQLAHTNR